MISIRRVTLDDVLALDALLPQEWRVGEPVGYAAERDGALVAIGTVTWDRWGRAWGWYNSREQLPAITMHRCAIEMLRMMREVRAPALYAICGLQFAGSVKWLDRLGFVPDETLTHELGPVYRCDLR